MYDIYEPRTMIEMVKQMPPLHTFIRDTFFSSAKQFYTERVEFDVVKGGMAMAPFVGPRIGSKTMEREGYRTMDYKPPLIAPKRVLTNDDIDVRLPGEAVYNGYHPGERQAQLLAEDLEYLDRAITRREEWMCCRALFNANIRCIGEGVDELIEFDFDNHYAVDDPWSDHVNSHPNDDLDKAVDIVAESGYSADVAIGDTVAMRHLMKNKEIKEMLDIKRYEMGVIAPERLRNGAIYHGYLSGPGLHLYSYSAKYADIDNPNPRYPLIQPEDKGFKPAVYNLVPQGKIFVGSTSMPAKMLYGLVKDVKIGHFAEKRVVKKWEQDEPAEKYLKISSRPLPCPSSLDSWVILDVL